MAVEGRVHCTLWVSYSEHKVDEHKTGAKIKWFIKKVRLNNSNQRKLILWNRRTMYIYYT